MTPTTNACACHSHLGMALTAVPDEVLKKLKGVSIPTVSLGYALAEAYPLSGTLLAEYEAEKARGGARS